MPNSCPNHAKLPKFRITTSPDLTS